MLHTVIKLRIYASPINIHKKPCIIENYTKWAINFNAVVFTCNLLCELKTANWRASLTIDGTNERWI